MVSFLCGIEDASIFQVCEIEDALDGSVFSRVAFAGADCIFGGFTKKQHASSLERKAYEQGVKEGESWSDYCILEDEDLRQFLDDIGWV
jgi:hypothetical protein